METLAIKSPADLLSFIGHTLGFWPQESLVCLTPDINHVGATLRVDLPRHDGAERTYARTSRSISRSDAYDKEGPSDEQQRQVRTLLGGSHIVRPMCRQ
ncbi:DUF4192 family protein [Arthrobacter sp. R4-81]